MQQGRSSVSDFYTDNLYHHSFLILFWMSSPPSLQVNFRWTSLEGTLRCSHVHGESQCAAILSEDGHSCHFPASVSAFNALLIGEDNFILLFYWTIFLHSRRFSKQLYLSCIRKHHQLYRYQYHHLYLYLYPPEVPFSAFLLVEIVDDRSHQEFVDDGEDNEESEYTHWSNVARPVQRKSRTYNNTCVFCFKICNAVDDSKDNEKNKFTHWSNVVRPVPPKSRTYNSTLLSNLLVSKVPESGDFMISNPFITINCQVIHWSKE